MSETRASIVTTTLVYLSSTVFISLLITSPHHLQIHAEAAATAANAPSPSSTTVPWPIDIMTILGKAGDFSIFIKFLDTTGHMGTQINTQIITSTQGLTVLAPTDAAFAALPSGALNKLSVQQKVQLIQYHVLPKFYSLDDLETATNPVVTQSSGSEGEHFWLNFTGGLNDQVNVSSGVVETQVSNALRKKFPLAVYEVGKVLLPLEFTKAHRPHWATAPPGKKSGRGARNHKNAAAAPKQPFSEDEPSPANGAAGRLSQLQLVFGLAFGVGVPYFCMALL
ncbi:unnamed protein product [Cuscuta europaea]|uniref:FAS1 domain-containing protein n=1 Tax=Cuscuta europaea TaxID=41803 RepID=A0A9P1E8X5_CUSEU|nr:unnamed protein product [Cuscuta europaea]